MKVVVNRCFGGFSISLACAEYMANRGHEEAAKEVAEYRDKLAVASKQDDLERKYGVRWYGYICNDCDADRADKILVEAVEALGKSASGEYAQLEVVQIPDDIEWQIHYYDGLEHVEEQHRTW